MKSDLRLSPKFFLGAGTPKGFVSNFGNSYNHTADWHTYIIKGGPGTGKSTLMKRVADYFIKKGARCYLCPCSSDPSSLDGVILPDLTVAILDGTSPHVVEPQYPGAVEEIVNLGECWDSALLHSRGEEIIELTDRHRACHRRASGFLASAGRLIADGAEFALSCRNLQKAERFSLSLARKTIPKTNATGVIWHRFLSAITPRGPLFYRNTISSLCDNVFVIADEYGGVSGKMLNTITEYALNAGHEVIACHCPLSCGEKCEHLLIPALRLGFSTANRYHTAYTENRVIHTRRFMDMAALHQDRSRLKFCRRATDEMLQLAADTMQEAKELHDALEQLYISAMDYAKLNKITENVVRKIAAEK